MAKNQQTVFNNFHELEDYLHNKGGKGRMVHAIKDVKEARRDDYDRVVRRAGDSSCSYTYEDFKNITTGESHEKRNETNSK